MLIHAFGGICFVTRRLQTNNFTTYLSSSRWFWGGILLTHLFSHFLGYYVHMRGRFMDSNKSVKCLWQSIITYFIQNKWEILLRNIFICILRWSILTTVNQSSLKWSCSFKQFLIRPIHYDLVHGTEVTRLSLNSGNRSRLSLCSFILT